MAQLINTFVRTVDLDVVDTDLSYKRVYFVYKNDLDSFCHGMTNHKGASNDIHTLLQDLDDGCCTIHFDLALALAWGSNSQQLIKSLLQLQILIKLVKY